MLEPDSPHRRHADQIHRAALRAAALTSQLLAFSRKQVLQPRTLDLNALVANLTVMLRRLIGEHVELRTTLSDRLGSVKADAGQIEQVVINLVINARDAMPSGGVLSIATDNVEIADARRGAAGRACRSAAGRAVGARHRLRHGRIDARAHLRAVLHDQGGGQGHRPRAVDGVRHRHAVGRPTSRSRATIGSGTTFRVYLPRIDSPTSASGRFALEDGAGPRGSETVLLVEDDRDVREFVRDVLRAHGYEVLARGRRRGGAGAHREARRRRSTSWSPTSSCRA